MPKPERVAKAKRRAIPLTDEQRALLKNASGGPRMIPFLGTTIVVNDPLTQHARHRLTHGPRALVAGPDSPEFHRGHSEEEAILERMTPDQLLSAFDLKSEHAVVEFAARGQWLDLLDCKHCGLPFLRRRDGQDFCPGDCQKAALTATRRRPEVRVERRDTERRRRKIAALARWARRALPLVHGELESAVIHRHGDDCRVEFLGSFAGVEIPSIKRLILRLEGQRTLKAALAEVQRELKDRDA